MKLGKKVSYIETDYHEFDELIREKYPFIKNYEYCADTESSNDISHTYKIDNKPLNEYDLERWEKLKSGNYLSYITHLLFNKLCIDGYIESGDYLVEVSW